MLTSSQNPLTVVVPIKTISGMNAREHWRARSRRVKAERSAVFWRLFASNAKPPIMPCTVTLTRLAPSNGLDSDNLQSSQKGVRDEVAKWLGIDDKSPLVTWNYAQRRDKTYAVIIEVSSAVEE